MLRDFAMQKTCSEKKTQICTSILFLQLVAQLLIFIFIFFLIFISSLSFFSTWLHCFLSSSQQLQQGHSIEVRTPLKHSKYLANTQNITNIWHIHKIFQITGKYAVDLDQSQDCAKNLPFAVGGIWMKYKTSVRGTKVGRRLWHGWPWCLKKRVSQSPGNK